MPFLESPGVPALMKLRQDAYSLFQPNLGPIAKKQNWDGGARYPFNACKKLHSTAACTVNIHSDKSSNAR